MSIRNDLLEQILAASGGAPLGMPTAPDDGNLYVAQGDQWSSSLSTSSSQIYSWSDDITATDPGIGKVKGNNADESLITEIYVSETTLNGAKIKAMGDELAIGDLLRIKQYGAGGNYVYPKINGEPVDNGGWWTIPVSISDNAGGFTDSVNVQLGFWATAGRDKAYIILESVTEQVMSTDQANPTVLDSWVVLDSKGISLQGDSIRNDTGRVINSMSGTIGIHPLVSGGGGERLLSLTSERSPDGVTYTLNNQNRPIYTRNNSETYNTKESYLTGFQDGEYVRFIAFADGAMSIAPSSATFRNQSITGPAALWVLVEA